LDFSGIAVPRFPKGVEADKMTNLCPVTVYLTVNELRKSFLQIGAVLRRLATGFTSLCFEG
jgi:hypothetical protein